MNFTQLSQKYHTMNVIVGLIFNPVLFIVRRVSKLVKKSGENVVVIAFLRIGDTVFSIPSINRIINLYKEKIIILCSTDSEILYREIFENVEYVNLNSKDFTFHSRLARSSARKKLKATNPKIIYDVTNTINSATLLINSGAKKIIGSNEIYFKSIYDEFSENRKTPNLTQKYIDATGIKNESLNESIPEIVQNLEIESSILIHPFAGWKAKEWNLNKFIELAKRISLIHPVRIIVASNKLNSDIKTQLKIEKLDLVETKSIKQLIKEIKICFAFIGCDSGPLYIAALFNKPTLTIYGPTNPLYSKQDGDMHEIVNKNLYCSPKKNEQYCFTYAGVYCPANQCINLLTVDEVYSRVEVFLHKFKHVNAN